MEKATALEDPPYCILGNGMLTSDKEIDKHIIHQVPVVYLDPNQYGHIESGSEHFHSISPLQCKQFT